MFPQEEVDKIISLLQSCDGALDEVIDSLLASVDPPAKATEANRVSDCGSSTSYQQSDEPMSAHQLLREYSDRVIDRQQFMQLEVKRDRLWRTAMGFYKNSLRCPDRLLKEFVVEFTGEEGIDGGALRCEFFENLLRKMDDELFEGDQFRRVPKKDCALEKNFTYAGMMIGHSILQGGPGYPCLCPAVYSFLLYEDKEKALQELPTLSDVPRTAATMALCSMVTEVSTTTHTTHTTTHTHTHTQMVKLM